MAKNLTKHTEKAIDSGMRHTFIVDVPTAITPEDHMRLVVGIDGIRQMLDAITPTFDSATAYKPKELVPVKAKDLKPMTIYWIKSWPGYDDLSPVWYYEVGRDPSGHVWAAQWGCSADTFGADNDGWWVEKR